MGVYGAVLRDSGAPAGGYIIWGGAEGLKGSSWSVYSSMGRCSGTGVPAGGYIGAGLRDSGASAGGYILSGAEGLWGPSWWVYVGLDL